MKYYLGIDGGATKTLAIICDENCNILGIGKAGPSNYHIVGLKETVKNIEKALLQASKKAKIEPLFEISCIALAAINSKIDYVRLFKEITKFKYFVKLKLVHDGEAALYSVTFGKKGIIVILGTGSLVAGYDDKNNYYRACNWGHIIGDEGSGYKIVIRTLNLALKEFDGRKNLSLISKEIKKLFKIENLDEISSIIYTDLTNEKISSFAPYIIKIAEKEKEVYNILKEEAKELAKGVNAIQKKINSNTVYLTGGIALSKKNKFYIDILRKEIKKIIPSCKIKIAKSEPIIGSLLIALKEENILNKKNINKIFKNYKKLKKKF